MNSIYDEAMKMAAENTAGQQRAVGAVPALGAPYRPYPSEGATPQDIIEYLTVQLGMALTERNGLRGRVWQLEGVNETHLARRQEAEDAIRRLRTIDNMEKGALVRQVQELRETVENQATRMKMMAPEKQFTVIGCFGAGAKVERPMEMMSCASANGRTTIRVDARVKRRKRVD